MEGGESRKRKREEYEMQMFGFHSRVVNATLKSRIIERIESKNKKLREALEKKFADPENVATLRMNEVQLVKAYSTAALPHLRNIENIVNKFISVPPNILGEEDKLQRIQYTEAELENIRRKLDNLQQRAKQATILNAALKEELHLIEQFSVCAENTDRLSHIINSAVVHPNTGEKIDELVKNYKEFHSSLDNKPPVSQKLLYNTIDNLKLIDCDMDSLTAEEEGR